jgi:dipeptidase
MNTSYMGSIKKDFACTTIAVGKHATNDGSVLVAHTDDDVSDIRVVFVPARDWDLSKEGEKYRNVYYDDCSLGHEIYVDSDKNKTYNASEIRRYALSDYIYETVFCSELT